MSDEEITDDDDFESDDFSYESCMAKARFHRSYLFKVDGFPLTAVFNFAKDRVGLAGTFIAKYAEADIKEGDPIAKKWDDTGWQALGSRVSWRLTPTAVEFSLASGQKYCLRRDALRKWLAGKDAEDYEFPGLEVL